MSHYAIFGAVKGLLTIQNAYNDIRSDVQFMENTGGGPGLI